MEKAYLAMGCFWGAERLFWQTPGVVETRVGYMGGILANPTYQQVCTDTTGHAETVEVTFDPAQITFAQLLEIFWAHHNSTTLNQQGADIGSQYRSAIFALSEAQRDVANEVKARLTSDIVAIYGKEPVTEIVEVWGEGVTFYPAEEYHQRYLAKNPDGYCSIKNNGLSCAL